MDTSIQYGTLLNYSPRGQEKISSKSREVKDLIKAARPKIIKYTIEKLLDYKPRILKEILNDETTLIPIPRSTPIKQDSVWPSKEICLQLLNYGLGMEISFDLERKKLIKKSSHYYSASTRPSVSEQYESLEVHKGLLPLKTITMVDDVLTQGRTSFACAMRLKEAFPKANIRLFCMIRTQGFVQDIERIFDPSIGEIYYNGLSGKTSRVP